MSSQHLETLHYESEAVRPISNGNFFRLNVSMRDVIFLLVLVGTITGNYFANSAKIDALKDQMNDMKQDIREIRHVLDRKP